MAEQILQVALAIANSINTTTRLIAAIGVITVAARTARPTISTIFTATNQAVKSTVDVFKHESTNSYSNVRTLSNICFHGVLCCGFCEKVKLETEIENINCRLSESDKKPKPMTRQIPNALNIFSPKEKNLAQERQSLRLRKKVVEENLDKVNEKIGLSQISQKSSYRPENKKNR